MPPNEGQVDEATSATQEPEVVTIGTVEGSRREDELTAQWKKSVHQLMMFVGGNGLRALKELSATMQRNGLRFGDEALAARQPVVPFAIYVDTNYQDVASAERDAVGAEQASMMEARRKEEAALVESLKDMGVEMCNIYNKALYEAFQQQGISGRVTMDDMPEDLTSLGAQADPRVGELTYLSIRNDETPNNPLFLAKAILKKWRETGRVNNAVVLTVVGGLHGGTGPLALSLMADVRAHMEKLFRGMRNLDIIAERYSITSQSAGFDNGMRSEPIHAKRELNTAVEVVRANDSIMKRGIEILPGERIEGKPANYHFIVNGGNPTRDVPGAEGHYEPARIVGKALAAKIVHDDKNGGKRANKREELFRGDCGPGKPNVPSAVFSSLGITEVIPSPDRAELTVGKKRIVFQQAIGMGQVDTQAVVERGARVFSENLLIDLLNAVEFPVKDASDFGEDEAAIKSAADETARFREQLRTELAAKVKTSQLDQRKATFAEIRDEAINLKTTKGLATALAFVQATLENLRKLQEAARGKLERDCSPERVKGVNDQVDNELRRVTNTKVFPFEIPLIGSKKEDLKILAERVTELTKKLTALSELTHDANYLRSVETELVSPVTKAVERMRDLLERELRTARAKFSAIAPDPRLMSSVTCFDVQVGVKFDTNPDEAMTLRQTLGDGEWTEAMMDELLSKIHVSDAEIGLMDKLREEPAIADLVTGLSHPLIQPALLKGQKNKWALGGKPVMTIPAETEADMKTVPAPEEAEKVRVAVNGACRIITEATGVNALMDDGYVRSCLEKLLATPPTLAQARKIQDTQLKLNREGQFPFRGQAEEMLKPVFATLAKRHQAEAGFDEGSVEKRALGEIRVCPAENCGVDFYRSETETRANIGWCCPGCRQIPGNEERARQAATATVTASAAPAARR